MGLAKHLEMAISRTDLNVITSVLIRKKAEGDSTTEVEKAM